MDEHCKYGIGKRKVRSFITNFSFEINQHSQYSKISSTAIHRVIFLNCGYNVVYYEKGCSSIEIYLSFYINQHNQ